MTGDRRHHGQSGSTAKPHVIALGRRPPDAQDDPDPRLAIRLYDPKRPAEQRPPTSSFTTTAVIANVGFSKGKPGRLALSLTTVDRDRASRAPPAATTSLGFYLPGDADGNGTVDTRPTSRPDQVGADRHRRQRPRVYTFDATTPTATAVISQVRHPAWPRRTWACKTTVNPTVVAANLDPAERPRHLAGDRVTGVPVVQLHRRRRPPARRSPTPGDQPGRLARLHGLDHVRRQL